MKIDRFLVERMTMTPEELAKTAAEQPSFLGQTLAWVAAGIAGIGAWLWTHTMGRLQKVEENKLDRFEFDKAMARIDKDRDERRETEIKLFDRLDHLKDMVQELRK